MLQLDMVSNNLCEKCTGVFVENEFHLLFRCNDYKEEIFLATLVLLSISFIYKDDI